MHFRRINITSFDGFIGTASLDRAKRPSSSDDSFVHFIFRSQSRLDAGAFDNCQRKTNQTDKTFLFWAARKLGGMSIWAILPHRWLDRNITKNIRNHHHPVQQSVHERTGGIWQSAEKRLKECKNGAALCILFEYIFGIAQKCLAGWQILKTKKTYPFSLLANDQWQMRVCVWGAAADQNQYVAGTADIYTFLLHRCSTLIKKDDGATDRPIE